MNDDRFIQEELKRIKKEEQPAQIPLQLPLYSPDDFERYSKIKEQEEEEEEPPKVIIIQMC